MKLLLKNLLFTVIVPGSVGVYIPILLGRGIEDIRPPGTRWRKS